MSENKIMCDICKRYDINNDMYGEMFSKFDINAHYYCLLSASKLPQRGDPNKAGIMGFLMQDIVACEIETRGNQCYLCKKTSAAINCSEENCDRWFHFVCGRNYNCITQFTGNFHSYCSDHVPDANRIHHNGIRCFVCETFLSACHPATSIFSYCCYDYLIEFGITDEKDMRKSFVCNVCMQKYCVNAGYDATCVMCNIDSKEKDKWQQQMRERGIYVPMQMATWEQDGRFKKHSKQKCENPDCKHPSSTKNVWTCRVCGCDPQHLKCAGVVSFEDYLCAKCLDQSFVKRVPL